MSRTILKIGDLLAIGKQTVKDRTVSNFTFQLELFIEHLNVSDGFETGDLDLDLYLDL